MSSVLIDSSIWIEYFKNSNSPISPDVDELIDIGNIFINDLILTELIPFLKIKKQNQIIEILQTIERFPMNIDWTEITEYQISNLKNGINKVGIPDLIIVQNALQNKASLYSLDKHFKLMSKNLKLKLY